MANEARLIYRVAHAYYEENLTQADIASRFGISRIKVSRMLGRAREIGVVQITVVPPEKDSTEIERRLERAYGLDEAIVADIAMDDYSATLDAIGRAAAQYLARVLEDGQTIGLTWGNTILATVNSLAPASFPRCRVVQMIGGLGELEAEIHGAELVMRASEKLGCRARHIHAPGIVTSQSVRDALVHDPQVADTLELARSADLALLGVGSLGVHSVLRGPGSVLTEKDRSALAALGVSGDIALRFFDGEGVPVQTPYSARTIGVDLAELPAIRRRVGVAGGAHKVATIRAALLGGYITVLVTDSRTASSLVESARENEASA